MTPTSPSGRAATIPALAAWLVALGAGAAQAAPAVDQNRGQWFDAFLDGFGLAPVASGLTDGVVHDPVGGRLVLAAETLEGHFATTPITPASLSAWGKIAVDRNLPSGARVDLWLLDPATDTLYGEGGTTGTRASPPAPLKLRASVDASLREEAAIDFLPEAIASVRVYGRVSAADQLRPTVDALRVTWAARSALTIGAAQVTRGDVAAGATTAFEVRVAVSHVDASGLVVTLPLPKAEDNPRAQDQRLVFIDATEGGQPSADGGAVVWRLGTRKAGQTFALRVVARVPSGLLDGTRYQGLATARADNAAEVEAAPFAFAVRSAPALRLDRVVSDLYPIDGAAYALGASTHEVKLWASNGGAANETLFDGLLVEDLSALVASLASGQGAIDPASLVIADGGRFVDRETPLPSGAVVPAHHIYWELGPLPPGRALAVGYAFTLRAEGPIPSGTTISPCARIASTFAAQQDDPGAQAGPACSPFTVPVPATPSAHFALGEEVRGQRALGPGEDLGAVRAGFGEAVSYLFHAGNGAVSELEDVVMIGKVPAGTTFVSAFLPAEARGTVHLYLEPDGFDRPGDAPPSFDAASGALGAGWSSEVPADPARVSWVAFRVPRLASAWFPRAGMPSAATGELLALVDPPEAACPEGDVLATADGHFFAYRYAPQATPEARPIEGGPIAWREAELTRVAPDLPSLPATLLAAPATLAPGGELTVQLVIPNTSPPDAQSPLDDALELRARLLIPTVPADGVPTPLRVLAIDAPGAAIDWELPRAIALAWAQPLAPGASRVVTLRLGAPPGVLSGATAQLAADVSARDDLCGEVATTTHASLAFSGVPALEVAAEADFAYGGPGTALTYTLRYLDPSLTPTTGTWLVSKPGPGLTVTRIEVPARGEVWVAGGAPGDDLPRTLSPAEPFDAALVRARFVRLTDPDGDGFVAPPPGMTPTFLAFLVDDGALAPPQLVTRSARSLRVEATVSAEEEGTIVTHQAAIFSDALLQATGAPAEFLVTPRPGLRLALACADVAAAQEPVRLTLPFHNDSANASSATTLTLTLPEGLSATSAAIVWNAAYLAAHPGAAPPPITLGDEVTARLGGLGPLEGGTLVVDARVDYYVASGTFLRAEVLGSARAADGATAIAWAACTTLVENADLEVRLLADNPAPRAGETVGLTLVVANQGAHAAHDLRLDATLPSALAYVADSALVTPSPWSLVPSSEPTLAGRTLTWAAPLQALTGEAGPATLPGLSGDVALRLRARVGDTVLPGTPLEICAGAATTTTDDGRFADTACTTLTTPLPDPWVRLSVPEVRGLDARAAWTLQYGNDANEVASGVVLFLSLPDGPSPPADGAVDLTWAGQVTAHGETVWLHQGAAGSTPPPFDRADPAAGGWVASPRPGAPVSHVALVVGRLEPYAAPRTAQVLVTVTDPSGAPIAPGSAFTGRALVAMRPGLRDQRGDNNQDDATLRVPGLDLAMHARCEPSGANPGLLPGGRFSARFELESSGIERAHGLGIDLALPAGARLESGPAPLVAVVDADGQPSRAIDASGRRIEGAVPWTRDGLRLVMGSLDPASPLWYRRVGLRPGDRARAEVTLAIADDVANRAVIDATAKVRVDYVEGFDPSVNEPEKLTDNNTATCGVTVYRADVLTDKAVVDRTTGSRTVADVDDVLDWTITWDNVGDHDAAGVVLEDAVPEGLAVIVGGFTNIDPEAADVSYSDDGGVTFAYTPRAAVGTPDPRITHVRLVWRGDVPAPAGGVFVQTSAADFARGTHAGTLVDTLLGGVVPGGANKCANVSCEAVDCPLGSYLPEGECCPSCRPSIDGCSDVPVVIEECSDLQLPGSPTWTGCFEQGQCLGGCGYPSALDEDDDRFGTASGMRVKRGYGEDAVNWMSCVREGGGAGCDRLRCFQGADCDPATPLWEQTWVATCPDAPMYVCEQGAWVDNCYAATGVALRAWVECLGLGLGERCEWLRPGDDCGACLSAGCAATPDELRVWGNVPWWVGDYFREPLERLIATVVELRLFKGAPEGFLPAVPLDACALPAACGEALAGGTTGCAEPCPSEFFFCQICDNGERCLSCLGAGEIGVGTPGAASECALVAEQWEAARARCVTTATERVRGSGLSEQDQAELLEVLVGTCDDYAAPDCETPASCAASSYTSPPVPGPDEGAVVSWRRALVEDASDAPEAIRYSVLDARTGEALPGLSRIASPADGVIDLSHVPADAHPRLELRVDFEGGGGTFVPIDNPEPEFDACVREGQLYIEPWHIDASGRVTGVYSACQPYLFTYTRAAGMRILPAHPHIDEAVALEPWGVSDEGHIAVTWYDRDWVAHALFWDPAAGWIDLEAEVRARYPELQVFESAAADVNGAGQVVGVMDGAALGPGEAAFDGHRPFMWHPLTGLTTIDRPIRWVSDAWGMRINEAGEVAGTAGWIPDGSEPPLPISGPVPDLTPRAYSWSSTAGAVRDIPLPAGVDYTSVTAQNQAGQLIVQGYVERQWRRSWLWSGSKLVEVQRADPKVDPNAPAFGYGHRVEAYDLDERGRVVGSYLPSESSGLSYAFLWTPGVGMRVIPGGGEAYAIAADGTVLVGTYGVDELTRTSRLFLWRDGLRTDIEAPPEYSEWWPHWYAWDGFQVMNDHLQLAGQAYPAAGGSDVAYTWEPGRADALGLLGWKVDYRTDRHPTVGLATEVGRVCADAVENRVSITTATPQVGTDNDGASASIAINRADLAVRVHADPAVAQPGERVSVTVTWDNRGPGPARGVGVTLAGPADMLFEGAIPVLADGTLEPGEGGSDTFELWLPMRPDGESVALTAAIGGGTLDCASDNDAASAQVVIGSYPNAWVALDAPPTVALGEGFEVALTYGNSGNTWAESAKVELELPAGVALESATGGWTQSGDWLTWSHPDGLAPGEVHTQTLRLVAEDCALDRVRLPWSATIVIADLDVDTSDDRAAAETLALAPAGRLAVTLTPSRGDARPGEVVTWALHLANPGDATVFGARVAVDLGALALAGTPPPGLGLEGRALVWAADTLGPGEAGAALFEVKVPEGERLALTAVATGRGACPSEATAEMAIAPRGVHLALAADTASFCPESDGAIGWIATVTNDGDALAERVRVSVAPGAGMAFVPGAFTGRGDESGDAALHTWTLDALAPGAALSFGFATRPSDRRRIEVPALVQGAALEVGSTALESTAAVANRCRPSLTVSQAWDATCATTGAERTLTIQVANPSASTLEGVTVIERLPAPLTLVAAPGATWDAAARQLTARVGTLRPGAERRLVVTLGVPRDAAPGTLYVAEAMAFAAGVMPQVSQRLGGGALACDDGSACTSDACTPIDGCVSAALADGAACDDGDACTAGDACRAGVCAGAAAACDDGNPCTVDACHPTNGCTHDPVADGARCDDGDRCSTNDSCAAGTCRPGPAVVCGAAGTCREAGVCDPATGACAFAVSPDGTACAHDGACAGAGRCEIGACVTGNPLPGECRCGDTWIIAGEQCDDGNAVDGDGCSASCAPEAGWVCFGLEPPEGEANPGGVCTRLCGNAVLELDEQCDDGNLTDDDGCSRACRIEPGFDCAEPGARCQSRCGDGVRVYPEHCDDGDLVGGDGCSATCQIEAGWECVEAGPCRPVCGDGVLVGGQPCDDGNPVGGDGCSATCVVEPGWSCPSPGVACVSEARLVLADDSAETFEDTPVDVVVVDNDAGREVRVNRLGRPAQGSVALVDAFTVRYTPAPGFAGDDRFNYEAVDRDGARASAWVDVRVAPVSEEDFEVASVDQSCSGTGASYRMDVALVGGSGRYLLDAQPVTAVFRTLEPSGKTATYVVEDQSASPRLSAKNLTGQVVCEAPPKSLVTHPDTITTLDGVGLVDVLANDEGEGLVLVAVDGALGGKATFGAEGVIRYTADAGFSGEERLLYRVADAAGDEDGGELVVTVPPGAFDARDDRASTTRGQPVVLDLFANDLGSATLSALGTPAHGTVRRGTAGVVTYTPASGFVGEDRFTYTLSAGAAHDTAVVSIAVVDSGACLAITVDELEPTCAGDGTDASEGYTVSLGLSGGSGVYTIDGATEGLTLHTAAAVDTRVASRTLAPPPPETDATFTSKLIASDTSLRLRVRDALSPATCTAKLTSTKVDCADTTPLEVTDDALQTRAMIAVLVRPLDNDRGVGLTTSAIAEPAHGTLEALELGVYRYTPAPGFTGTERLAYAVRDARGATDGGVIAIRVDAHDPAVCEGFGAESLTPTCSADLATVTWRFDIAFGSGRFRVGDRDTDARQVAHTVLSGAPIALRVEDLAAPECGAFTVVARHTCVAPPRAPSAQPDQVSLEPGATQAFDPLANDVGQGLVVTAVGRPAAGTISALREGGWLYAPKVGFSGVDTASYTITDGAGRSASGRITFYVNDVAALRPGCTTCALTAVDDRLRLTLGAQEKRDVLANDLGDQPKLVDYQGFTTNDVQVTGSTFTVTGTRTTRGERIAYRVRDARGHVDEGVLLLVVDAAPECEANAGAILAAPPAACGVTLEALGYQGASGYAQGFVVTDLLDRVVAFESGATFVTSLPPGDYRVRAFNWRVAATAALPIVGEALAPSGCHALSAPVRYTELTPIALETEAICEGGGYQLALVADGGEPAAGLGGYLTELSAAPPYRPAQVVVVTVSDDAGCATTRAVTMPTAPCGGTR